MSEARSDGGGGEGGGAGSQRRKTKTPHGDVGKIVSLERLTTTGMNGNQHATNHGIGNSHLNM